MSGKAGDDFTDQTDPMERTDRTGQTDQYVYESALADALGGLGSGAEPPMPDLVPGAVVRGTRMRRRRRVGATVSAAVMAGVLVVGGHALLAPRPESTPTLPAGQSSVWYPSLELLQSILPADNVDGGSDGTSISAGQPRQPLRPGRYFTMTTTDGSVNNLYVSVSRTATDPSYAHPTRACVDNNGRVLASAWNGLITRCSLTERGSGSLLLYFVTADSWATGVTYLTPGGWTVQVIAGSLGAAGSGRSDSTPRTGPLVQLATDPRIFDAVKGSGGG
ncbi:hypothetical protein ACFWP5_17070 [Streptomyces sp. NPDC058469]|uniref:hypothetical protein n=1 Tax=Streptomyces sp. NPDC058469 TaxID=3346514 RepID=UPI00364739FF